MSSPKTAGLYARKYKVCTYLENPPTNARGIVIPNDELQRSLHQIKGYPYAQQSTVDLFSTVQKNESKIKVLEDTIEKLNKEWEEKLEKRDKEWEEKLEKRDKEWEEKLEKRDKEWEEKLEKLNKEWEEKTRKMIEEALHEQKRSFKAFLDQQ